MTLQQIELKKSCIWPTYKSMQWPCPDGFHVPLTGEWQALVNAMTAVGIASQWNSYSEYLKIPFAGWRDDIEARAARIDTEAILLSSSPDLRYHKYSRALYLSPNTVSANYDITFSFACSIRCFKNIPVAPDNTRTKLYWTDTAWIFHNATLWLISIVNWDNIITIADKNLWATQVYNFGDTLTNANCGNYYQRWNNYWFPWPDTPESEITTSSTQVDTTWYWPWNYYSNSTFILMMDGNWSNPSNDNLWWWQYTPIKRVTIRPNWQEKQIRPVVEPIEAWIYHSATLWLITIADWNWNDITIADKNLWASTVYNEWDTLSEANCWKYYQWWNNYGFPYTWAVTTSSTQVDASTYWPWNYYSSSTFITASSSPYERSSVQNDNLWGAVTWTNEAMQWPCPNGFHVPQTAETQALIDIMTAIGIINTQWNSYSEYLKIPFSGYRHRNSTIYEVDNFALFWTSSPKDDYASYFEIGPDAVITNKRNGRSYALSIRPFKNEVVAPDNTWTVLYSNNILTDNNSLQNTISNTELFYGICFTAKVNAKITSLTFLGTNLDGDWVLKIAQGPTASASGTTYNVNRSNIINGKYTLNTPFNIVANQTYTVSFKVSNPGVFWIWWATYPKECASITYNYWTNSWVDTHIMAAYVFSWLEIIS